MSDLVERPERFDALGVAANRLATRNVAVVREPVAARRSPRARRTSDALPSTPTTAAPRRAIGSVKLPMPQKKSAMRSPGLRVEQRHRAPHQHPVDRRIDLRELGGREGELEIEFGQRVGERAAAPARNGAARRRAARLQAELDAVRVGECGERRFVVRARAARGCAARARARRAVAVADRQLDLRQAIADRSARRSARAARAAASEILRGSTCARRHVGDVARFALVKADQHAALLRDVPHRQPRAMPVSPRRAVDRRQQQRRRARGRGATARPRACAAWRRPARRRRSAAASSRRRRRNAGSAASTRAGVRLQRSRRRARSRSVGLRLSVVIVDALAGQRAFDEHRLAVDARDAAALLVERCDRRDDRRSRGRRGGARLASAGAVRATSRIDCNCAWRRRVTASRRSSRIRPMRILALDTSTEWCSVAVGDGTRWQRARRARRAGALGARCCRWCDAVLAEAGWALARSRRHRVRRGPRLVHRRSHRLRRGAGTRVRRGPARRRRSRRSRRSRRKRCRAHGWTRVARLPRRADARGLRRRLRASTVTAGGSRPAPAVAAAAGMRVADRRLRGRWSGAGNGFAAYPALASQLALADVDAPMPPDGAARSASSRCRGSPPGEGVAAARRAAGLRAAPRRADDRRARRRACDSERGRHGDAPAIHSEARAAMAAAASTATSPTSRRSRRRSTPRRGRSATSATRSRQATAARVGEREGRIVAYGVLMLAPGEAQILNLSVVPDARREGLGRALLRRFVDDASDSTPSRSSSRCARRTSPRSRLYESEGFAPVARRVDYYPGASADASARGCARHAARARLPRRLTRASASRCRCRHVTTS